MVDTMITLHESTEMSFTTNGLGALSDAITCEVTEERNGEFELEMEYPVTGIRYKELQLRRIIMAKPNLGEKDILNPSEAIEYFVLSRRKFYDLLKNTDGEDFLAYYGERKLIIRVAFEKYLLHHPELRRQV